MAAETSPSILFVIDHSHSLRLNDGQEPYAAYSHVFNAFCMAHEAARLGWRTYLKAYNEETCYQVLQVYPILKLGKQETFSNSAFKPGIIAALLPFFLASHRFKKPDAIGVLFYPAHHWLESATAHEPAYIDGLRLTLAYDVDYVITQNPRMQELASHLFALSTRWEHKERILCAPLGYVPEQLEHAAQYDRQTMRRRMGASDNDIVIINSGGPWDWTDIEAFLHGFIQAVRKGAKRLKFYQIGLRQKTNTDHEYTMQLFRRIMTENYDLIGHNLVVIEEWERGSDCLPDYNYGADIGLNVSKDSVENYQAHRVRFVEYIKAGLPVLNTSGDYLSRYEAKDACLTVESGDIDGYCNVLMQLNNEEIDLHSLHKKAVEFRPYLASDHAYPPVLNAMKNGGRLPEEERQDIIGAYKDIYDQFEFCIPNKVMQMPQ